MKQNFLLILILSLSTSISAQYKRIGFQLSAGMTVGHVRDDDPSPSDGLDAYGFLVNPADGLTTKQGDGEAMTANFYYEEGINDKIAFSIGLGVAYKTLIIGNQDGQYPGQVYFGTSKYNITYLQIPVNMKFYFAELAPKFKLYGKLGLTLDIKAGEGYDKARGDGAHYWNLAKNLTYNDYRRGKNADHKPKALFAFGNIGVPIGLGGEFDLGDLSLFLGFSYNFGLLNVLNPGLKHDDMNETPVTHGLSIHTDMFLIDMGIAMPLNSLGGGSKSGKGSKKR